MRFITHIISSLTRFLPGWKYILMSLVFCAGYTFAAGDTTQDSDVIAAIVQVLNLIFTVITFLLTPAIILCGWLLSPDWTMGDFFGLRPYFIQVWVLVSNLVYIIFALMLLWMAIMQIFSSESNYAFKKKLPRFLVGIMIVPFTWLIVSWTLSFANQAVAAVLSIPSGAIASMNKGDTGIFHLRTIPTEFTLNFAEDAPGASAETVTCVENGETKSGNIKCISPAEFISKNSSGPFFIIMVYAYDIFKIQKTEMIDFEKVCKGVGEEGNEKVNSATCISDLGKLLRKFGVAFITTTFFAIILIALCWVLLARAFKLWIYVMFSPLFGLAYALSDEGLGKTHESEGGGEGVSLGEVGLKPFFSLAMVPVLVSAVLSFGLLFIGVINNTFSSGSLADNGSGTYCTTGEFMVKYCIQQDGDASQGYSSYIIIGNEGATVGEGGDQRNAFIKFNFGSMLSDFVGNSVGQTATGAVDGFANGVNDIFAHIILSLIALAVMWMGVKAAVAHDEITKAAFAPFAKFGDSVGNFVQHIPSYLPTPHPAFSALTPGGMEAMAQVLQTKVNNEKQERVKTLEEIVKDPSLAGLQGLSSSLENGSVSVDEFANRLNEASRDSIIRKKETQQALLAEINKIPESATFTLEKKKEILRELGRQDISGGEIASIVSQNADVLTAASPTIRPLVESAKQLSGSSSGNAPSIGQATVNGTNVTFAGNASSLRISGTAVSGMTQDFALKIREKQVGGTLSADVSKQLFGTDLPDNQKRALVTEANKSEFNGH